MLTYNKDKIKEILTTDKVLMLINELGGDAYVKNDHIVSRTICHNHPHEGQHKLYWYENTKLCHCYTGGCEKSSFDIFELVCNYKNHEDDLKIYYENGKPKKRKWTLGDAVQYVANYFNLSPEINNQNNVETISDWEYFDSKIDNSLELVEKKVEWKIYENNILKNLSHNNLDVWRREGISDEIMQRNDICFDPKKYGIVIPHYNINHELIGIRERFLLDEDIEYGKYRPAILNGIMYSHPLGLNLYNLDNSKDNIRNYGIAIAFEGEKGALSYASYFGAENDISVATCGSHISEYQINLLLSLGVKEIIIAFDRQFKEKGDKEFKQWTDNLSNIKKKYGNYCTISFIFDIKDRLPYKASPIDMGKDIFIEMFKERI